jgi:hypothetical protein
MAPGPMSGRLGKQLGNANTQVLYGNYSDEMNRRMQAAGQAQQALAQQQQAQNANFAAAACRPSLRAKSLQGINALGNSLGALFNGGTSKSTGKKGDLDYHGAGGEQRRRGGRSWRVRIAA